MVRSLSFLICICVVMGFTAALQISFFLTLKRKFFFWLNMAVFSLLISIRFLISSGILALIYDFAATGISCLVCCAVYREKKYHKLYSAIHQMIVSISSVYLADRITEHLLVPLQWSDLSIAAWITFFNVLWCGGMYYGKRNVFTILPEPEENYRKTFFRSLTLLLLVILYSSGGDRLLNSMVGMPLVLDIFLFLILVLALLNILNLCVRANDQMLHEEHLMAVERQGSIMEQYINELLDHSREINRMEHDQRHLLSTLSVLMDSGKYKEVSQILAELTERKNGKKQRIYSDNASVNAILTDAMRRCDALSVSLAPDIRMEMPIAIENVDLIVLLKNALDNAIDACEKFERRDQIIIRFSLVTAGGFLALKCTNPVVVPVFIVNNHVDSTKYGDGRRHGIGLESMRAVTGKYNGKFHIAMQNNLFTLTATLENCQPFLTPP